MTALRRSFRITLSLIILTVSTVGPGTSFAKTTASPRVLTDLAVAKMQNGKFLRRQTLAKFGKTSAELALRASTAIGRAAFTDVLQASLIMYLAASAQLTHDRMKRDRLLDGQTPKTEDIQQTGETAAQDILCANSAEQAGVRGEIFCSGEFWVGVMGSFAGQIGVHTLVPALVPALKYLVSTPALRSSLVKVGASFVISALTLGSFVFAGHLWTEATQIAISKNDGTIDRDREKLAHNLFGRAIGHYVGGDWKTYLQTPEGELAQEIFTNMYNILILDKDLRAAWLYNGWRFGVARGELIINITMLATALSAGSAVGASGGAWLSSAFGITGGSAAAVGVVAGAVVSTLFATGVSYATVYLPDYEIGGKVTRAIQKTRAWMASNRHNSARGQLSDAAGAFDVDSNKYDQRYYFQPERRTQLKKMFPSMLASVRTKREFWAGVTLEQYFELSKVVSEAQLTILQVQEVLKNSKLRESIIVKDQGEYMTLEAARQKHCPVDRTCDFPLSYQLERLEEARATVLKGEDLLSVMATEILEVYRADEAILGDIKDNNRMYFAPNESDVAAKLQDELETAMIVREIFEFDFGSIHESVRQKFDIRFQSEDFRQAISRQAPEVFGYLYIHGIDELRLKNEALKSAPSDDG